MPNYTSLQQLLDTMPARFDPEQAGDTDTTVQLDLSGEGGGQWYATIADKKLSVQEGAAPKADSTVSVSVENLLAMANGQLKPMTAFMMGKIKVKGSVSQLMKLQSLFS